MDAGDLALISNREIIAVDQAGVSARPLDIQHLRNKPQQAWLTTYPDGSAVLALFNLDQASAVDLPGQCKDLRPLAGGSAECGEGGGAMADDPRDTGERFDVVDDGRLAAEAAFDRVGRPQPRHPAFSFERLDQRGLLAADECAGAFAHFQVQRIEIAARAGLDDRGAYMAHCQRVFGADIQVALGGSDGVRGNGQAFQNAMRVGFEHGAVHEGAGIAFVAIADDVFDGIGLGAPKRPFAPGRETRAAAAAQAGFGDGGNHLFRG